MSTGGFPRERRHTLHFLDEIRSVSPVFLDTEVDMTEVVRHRESAARRYSVPSYALFVGGRVLALHPEANAAYGGLLRPRLARYAEVRGKLTLDRVLGDRRVVLAGLLPDLQDASLHDIQDRLEYFRDGDPETLPEFAGARALHRLPVPIGGLVYRLAVRPLSRRAEVFGTLAVTSLGHRSVEGFYSVGGTTITLGLGRITDRVVARAGTPQIRPVMRLSLTFDHRVIDGAEAADILTEIKDGLENLKDLDDHAPERPLDKETP